MDHKGDAKFDLLERSARLLGLMDILNLENCDKTCFPFCAVYPFVVDFARLRHHVCEQKKIICSYGLDNPLFDDAIFKRMQVLVSQLLLHSDATMAYCTLKSQLFLEENDFFDEVFSKVDSRLKSCTSEDEVERLLLTAIRLRNVYDVYLPRSPDVVTELLLPSH